MKTLFGLDRGQKSALVVVECQNRQTNPAFQEPERAGLMQQVVERGIIARINRLSAAFRSAGLPVIFCTIAARPGFVGFRVNCLLMAQLARHKSMQIGNPAAAINDALVVAESDIVNNRSHGVAIFTGTELDAILRGLDVETVVLAGVSTNVSLPTSAAEAVGLGYNVVLAEDCTAGGTPETHAMQVSMHLPFLATIAASDAVMAAIGPG